jgi:single-strand DNA-binding protein
MYMSFAQVQLLGNTGRDPEMSYSPNGDAVTKFSIAVTRKTKEKEVTTWFNCIAFRNQAETINHYVHKGDMVFVQGTLDVRQYTTKDGRNGTALDVLVDKFAFAGGKKGTGTGATITPLHGDEGLPDDPLGDLEDHPF